LEEWEAFWRIGQIREIVAPGFAYRANLAHEEGLLDASLAGRDEVVQAPASKLIDALFEKVRWRDPPILLRNKTHSGDQLPGLEQVVSPDTVYQP
jgi:hypothetical protein